MTGDQDDPSTDPSTDPGASAGRSFGSDPEAYERGRPSYPRDAATWLTSDHPCAILELGAGTGKLTRELVALGHEVDATDPDAAMLEVLQRETPGVETAPSPAEAIPAPDRSYDVVVAAQAAHWFDLERALPEIARVLRPGGRLSLVWNERDERIPWVRRLGALLAAPEAPPDRTPDQSTDRSTDQSTDRQADRLADRQADRQADRLADPAQALEDSGLFGPVEASAHRFWQVVDRHSIQDLVRSRSWFAGLDEPAQAARLADVLAFYDDYGRGMDGMQLPYRAQCYRATVRRQVRLQPPAQPAEQTSEQTGGPAGGSAGDDTRRNIDDTMPRGLRARHRAPAPGAADRAEETGGRDGRDDGDDDQVLLIDFH